MIATMSMTSSDPFVAVVLVIFNILLYVAVLSTPILILTTRKRHEKRFEKIEKEISRLNYLLSKDEK